MPARLSSTRFVGRQSEMNRLEGLWKSAVTDERAATVLVGGEAGVGKSRLVAELATRLAAPALVLVGQCLNLVDRALPFAPVVQVLRALHRELDAATLDAVIGPARDELGALLPELHGAPAPDGLGTGAIFEQLLGVFERLAEHVPTLVVLEDLHWADASTRELLVFLAHTLRASRLVLLGTFRSDDLHRRHPLRSTLAELDRSGAVERLELRRFDLDEVRELIASIVGHEPSADLVASTYERSDGNAFFAEELLACNDSGNAMPPSLRDIVLARIDALGEDVQHVLRCAAVVGRSVSHRVLAAIAELPEPRLSVALREAVAQHVLVTDGDALEYRFRHALVREAVEEDLLPGEFVALHTRVAELLTTSPELFDPDTTQVPAELACHWNATGDARRAMVAALDAARAAEHMYAYTEALAHAERALGWWSQVPDAEALTGMRHVDVMRMASNYAELCGSADRALDYVRAAVDEVDTANDPVTAGLLHERWGRYLWMLSRSWDEILGHCELAVELVPDDAGGPRARVLATLGQQLMLNGRNREAIVACDDAIRVARECGEAVIEGHARNTKGTALAAVGRSDEGLAELHRARVIAVENRAWGDVARAAVNEGGALEALARHDEALQVALEGAEIARAHGLDRAFGSFLRLNAAETLWDVGDWDALEEQLREVQVLDVLGIDQWRLCSLSGLVAVARGDYDGARREANRLRELLRPVGSVGVHDRMVVEQLQVMVELWEGRPEAALRTATDAMAEPSGPLFLCTDVSLWVALDALIASATLANRGDTDALASTRAIEARLQQWLLDDQWEGMRPGALDAVGANVAAEVARASGGADSDLWSEAVRQWERFGFRPREAYARWRHAESLLRAGDREAAEVALRAAYRVACEAGWAGVREGILSLARRARLELGLDESAPLTAAERYGLTARELDVLALVAEGRTNRQIADVLFISAKTASVHVSNILAKLGVTNRGEAAAAARRLGLDLPATAS